MTRTSTTKRLTILSTLALASCVPRGARNSHAAGRAATPTVEPATAQSDAAAHLEASVATTPQAECADAGAGKGLPGFDLVPVQALRYKGELYVVLDSHTLLSFDASLHSTRVHLPGVRVVAILRARSGALWALDDAPAVWTGDGSSWTNAYQAPPLPPGDAALALAERSSRPVIMTRTSAITFNEHNAPSRKQLDMHLPKSLQSECAITEAGFAYIGVNFGEFGGGLIRIDLATGRVGSADHEAGEGGCSGTMNPTCHPVTAVLVDDSAPDCVWAAIGIRHMGFEHGGVVRVCDGRHFIVDFEKPAEVDFYGHKFPTTEPVMGLARARAGFVASTPYAAYVVDEGAARRLEWGQPREVCGLSLFAPTPEVLGVLTRINNRLSVSGLMPLVATEE